MKTIEEFLGAWENVESQRIKSIFLTGWIRGRRIIKTDYYQYYPDDVDLLDIVSLYYDHKYIDDWALSEIERIE